MSTFKIGQRVWISLKHWLRPYTTGTVVEYDPHRHKWRVKFDEEKDGGGFTLPDEPGQFLWFDTDQLEVIDDPVGSNSN